MSEIKFRHVPSGWKTHEFGQVASRVVRKNLVGNKNVLTISAKHGLVSQAEYFQRRVASSDASSYFLLERGDFAYNKSYSEGYPAGVIRRLDRYDSGIVSPLYICFRPGGGVDSNFLTHYFESGLLNDEILWVAKEGVRNHGLLNVKVGDFFSLPLHLPPIGEQRRIAEVLDTLDRSVSSIQASVAKHGQVRLAHVRELMADGLHILRSVEASELGSLGTDDQGSWYLTPLGGALIGIEAGNSPSVEDTPAGPGEWGVLKVSAIGRSGFRPEENKVAYDRSLHIEALCVRPGDLLITRANTAELVGMTCIVGETPHGLMLCDKTLRLHVNDAFASTEYIHLVLALAEIRRQIEIAATGTSGSMKNISQASIRRLMIPWSGRPKMDHVVHVDAGYAAQVDALARQARRLTQLKQGLMEDLLTGRVRVSEAEAVLEDL
ncbi:hypothetical protein [Herbidospora cretacea]|uniref:restriction endonuclease subunit S n=1 Tax=Herbidospora cretacea TaxID=28444 RepID=UPI000A56A6A0|nr:hypothetical protein [Herbidospora cretacea]